MWVVPGGQHNTTFLIAGPAYFINLTQFFNKCKGVTQSQSLSSSFSQASPSSSATPVKVEPEVPKQTETAPAGTVPVEAAQADAELAKSEILIEDKPKTDGVQRRKRVEEEEEFVEVK